MGPGTRGVTYRPLVEIKDFISLSQYIWGRPRQIIVYIFKYLFTY